MDWKYNHVFDLQAVCLSMQKLYHILNIDDLKIGKIKITFFDAFALLMRNCDQNNLL